MDKPVEIAHGDRRYEIGLAYEGVREKMLFNLKRKIDLAYGMSDNSFRGFMAWIGLFGASKALSPVEHKTALAILEAVYLWLPVFGMLLCVVYMIIGRVVYRQERSGIEDGLKYEDFYTNEYGMANRRYREIVDAKYHQMDTVEAAGLGWMCLWLTIALISRYHTL